MNGNITNPKIDAEYKAWYESLYNDEKVLCDENNLCEDK